MARHGKARKLQQQNASMKKGKVTSFKSQGMHKKYAKMSPSQFRNMFPELMHLSDVELVKQAIKRIEKKGKL